MIETELEQIIPSADTYPPVIYKAMRYSLLAGGKRLRPLLVQWSARAVGGDPHKVLPAACAIEMIHTYSLIHDDLPALDNDDYRRGRLSCHKAFDEATAILAGDALLTEAFHILACNGSKNGLESEALVRVIGELAGLAGTDGMIGGQVVDIESEGCEVDTDTMRYMHEHKTGALLKAAVRTGAILQGAGDAQLSDLSEYAEQLGLAFQITDDILDITGTTEQLGKVVGSDEKNSKATYPKFYGLDKSRELAVEATKCAVAALAGFGEEAEPLRRLALYLLDRSN